MQKYFKWIGVCLLMSACTHMRTANRGESRSGRPETRTDTTYDPSVTTSPGVPPAFPEISGEQAPQVTTRFAQAQFAPAPGLGVQGNARFEQMPNSAIGMYRLEGLKAKNYYQVSIVPSEACGLPKAEVSAPVYVLRANKEGYSESSFRTDRFTVSEKEPLVGRSIAVSIIGLKKESRPGAMVACGPIVPATAQDIHPTAPPAGAEGAATTTED